MVPCTADGKSWILLRLLIIHETFGRSVEDVNPR